MFKGLVDYSNPASLGSKMRRRRFERIERLVRKVLAGQPRCRIIDIGGTASYWRLMDERLLESCDVTITNLEVPKGHDPWTGVPSSGQFSFHIGDGRRLEFSDQSFDIAHSNSVIEHVGTFADMQMLVAESRRLARSFYIQTPYFWFPVEPHFGLPLIHYLPMPLRSKLLIRFGDGFGRRFNGVAEAMSLLESINLIDRAQARALLLDGERLEAERVFGLTKSLVLLRSG